MKVTAIQKASHEIEFVPALNILRERIRQGMEMKSTIEEIAATQHQEFQRLLTVTRYYQTQLKEIYDCHSLLEAKTLAEMGLRFGGIEVEKQNQKV